MWGTDHNRRTKATNSGGSLSSKKPSKRPPTRLSGLTVRVRVGHAVGRRASGLTVLRILVLTGVVCKNHPTPRKTVFTERYPAVAYPTTEAVRREQFEVAVN